MNTTITLPQGREVDLDRLDDTKLARMKSAGTALAALGRGRTWYQVKLEDRACYAPISPELLADYAKRIEPRESIHGGTNERISMPVDRSTKRAARLELLVDLLHEPALTDQTYHELELRRPARWHLVRDLTTRPGTHGQEALAGFIESCLVVTGDQADEVRLTDLHRRYSHWYGSSRVGRLGWSGFCDAIRVADERIKGVGANGVGEMVAAGVRINRDRVTMPNGDTIDLGLIDRVTLGRQDSTTALDALGDGATWFRLALGVRACYVPIRQHVIEEYSDRLEPRFWGIHPGSGERIIAPVEPGERLAARRTLLLELLDEPALSEQTFTELCSRPRVVDVLLPR